MKRSLRETWDEDGFLIVILAMGPLLLLGSGLAFFLGDKSLGAELVVGAIVWALIMGFAG